MHGSVKPHYTCQALRSRAAALALDGQALDAGHAFGEGGTHGA